MDEIPKSKEPIGTPPFVLSTHTEQGKRDYQEDRFVVESIEIDGRELQLLAVMDGHAGAEVAEVASLAIKEDLIASLEESGGNIASALAKVVVRLDQKTKGYNLGSTLSAVVVDVQGQKAHIAILGDSPVIIKDRDGKLNISPEHNAQTNEQERQVAVDRGAVFIGGYLRDRQSGQSLQLSRALGNADISFTGKQPDIYEVPIGKGSVIIVGSDGIFPENEHHQTDAQRMVQTVESGWGARSIVDLALTFGSSDNVTAIVYKVA